MTAAPLSIADAAAKLGCGKSALYDAIRQGECPLPVIRVGRTMRIPAAQVDFYAIFGRVGTTAELLEFVQGQAS